MIDEQLEKLYKRLGLELPSHEEHGEFNRDSLERLQTRNWRMVAPGVLQADTAEGLITTHVPNDLICKGTDKEGLPILEKINL